MSELSSFKDMMDTGYEVIEGIRKDTSLTPNEQEKLVSLDPTVEQVQGDIADIFAAEEAETARVQQSRPNRQDTR